MNYTDFLQCIQESTKETAGEGGTVTVNHIIKNNGCELDGLVIMEKDSRVSPTIYLNNFYHDFQEGRGMEDIVCEITQIYVNNKDKLNVNPEYFMNFDAVKHTIVYKIINYEKNEKLLEKVPHKKILDLAVVFYCLLEQQAEGNATALIYHSHLNTWSVTEDEVYNAAIENTPLLLQSCIKPMSSIIQEMIPDDLNTEDPLSENADASHEMFVLTNQSKLNGAACILYDDVLKNFASKIDNDLYILPSSIHEVILLPKLDAFDKAELINMVREVNAEGVSYDEILSDQVYTYSRQDGMISL
jgi:hypothetical protein